MIGLVVIVFALIVAAAVGLAAFRAVKRNQARMAAGPIQNGYTQFLAQMEQLGERAPSRKLGGQRWNLEWGERRFTSQYVPNSEGPSFYSLSTELEPVELPPDQGPFRQPDRGTVLDQLPQIVLRVENKRDRLGKRMRLNREVQTGDARFDKLVYVESDADQAVIDAILTKPEVRQIVINLLELGCTRVALNYLNNPVEIAWTDGLESNPLAKVEVTELLEYLTSLVNELPPFASVKPVRGLARGGWLLLTNLLVFIAMIPLVAIAATLFDTFGFDVWGHGILLALVTGLIMTAATFIRVRGRSHALRTLFWGSLMVVIGYPLFFTYGLTLINGNFSGPDQERTTEVVRKGHSSSEGSTTYYVRVAPWPPHTRPIKLKLDQSDWDQLAEGLPVIVRYREGCLGYEWFVGVSPPR